MPKASLTLWQCTNTDVVNFSTAPAYAPSVTKTFAQWGIEDGWDGTVGGLKDKVTLQFPAGALNANSPFTFQSKVQIFLDGKSFFMGYVSEDVRNKSGVTDQSQLVIMGPWWYLQNLVYQFQLNVLQGFTIPGNQPIFQLQSYTHFTLNLLPVYTLTNGNPITWQETITLYNSQQMIKLILDYAISQGAWLSYKGDLSGILNVPVHPKDVLNITCDGAIAYQFKDYDVATWFDYSGNTPVFNCIQRKNLPTLTRALAVNNWKPNLSVEGFKLRRRYDLVCPYVQIAYEQPITVDGETTIEQAWDIYPAPLGWVPGNVPPAPQNSFKALITTVPLRAITIMTHQKMIQTLAINMLDIIFWQAMKPETNPAVNPNAANEYYGLQLDSPQRQSNLPNIILRGGYHPQMGGAVAVDDLIVIANYQRRIDANRVGSKITAHTWRRHAKVTNVNFPQLTYFKYSSYSSTGDVINNFDGMAAEIYEDLNPPNGLWEGTIPLMEATYSGQIVMGFALNLNNTLPQHAAMAALIQSISFKVRSGAIYYSLEIGPNKTISAQQIADRLRAARYTYIQVFNFGNQPNATNQDILPTEEESAAMSESAAAMSQHNVNGAPDANGNVTQTQTDAATGLSFGTYDPTNTLVPTAPSMSLNPADLTANDALNN